MLPPSTAMASACVSSSDTTHQAATWVRMASRICHVKPIASAAIAAPITIIFHRVFSGRIECVGELASGMCTITGLVRFYASGCVEERSKQEGKPRADFVFYRHPATLADRPSRWRSNGLRKTQTCTFPSDSSYFVRLRPSSFPQPIISSRV